MKYANIDCNTIGVHNACDECYFNWGDHIQVLAIDYIYQRMGIDLNDVVKIPFDQLQSYDGEPVILPVNFLFFLPPREDGSIFSDKIVPVFLAAAFSGMIFTEKCIQYFRRFEPVGCRDENMYNIFKSHGIEAYLNGCMTAALPRREPVDNDTKRKVLLIDIPEAVLSKVPKEYADRIEILTNADYGTPKAIVGDLTPREFAIKKYKYIADNAELVVTSRLHVASPCAAMGIPVALVKPKVSTHFAWLDKLLPVFSEKNYDNINWKPEAAEYDDIKELMLSNAISRISNAYDKYNLYYSINNYFSNRTRYDYEDRDPLDIAIRFVNSHWQKNETFEYALWGITMIAEGVYSYISENFPNARLGAVIDKYKEGYFHGVRISKPSVVDRDFKPFLLVTTAGGAAEAHNLCSQLGFDDTRYRIIVTDISTCK